MSKTTCDCGNSDLRADKITLVLYDVPITLTSDGPQYDDSDARYCEGWDWGGESAVSCHSCGKKYEIVQEQNGEIGLMRAKGGVI